MEFKFLSIKHFCYNEQMYAMYTMFNIWKRYIISSICVDN